MVEADRPEQRDAGQPWYTSIGKIILMMCLFNFVRQNFFSGESKVSTIIDQYNNTTTTNSVSSVVSTQDEAPDFNQLLAQWGINTAPTPRQPLGNGHDSYSTNIGNLWRDHAPFTLDVYFSPNETISWGAVRDNSDPLTHKVYSKRHTYSWDDDITWFGNDPVSSAEVIDLVTLNPAYPTMLYNNQTLYSHIYMYIQGTDPDPSSPRYRSQGVITLSHPLTKFETLSSNSLKPRRSLLSSLSSTSSDDNADGSNTAPVISSNDIDTTTTTTTTSDDDDDDNNNNNSIAIIPLDDDIKDSNNPDNRIMMLVPDLTIRMVYDFTVFPPPQLPVPLRDYYTILSRFHGYKPPALISRFWSLGRNNIRVSNNSTMTSLPITIQYYPTSLMRFQAQTAVDQAWESQIAMGIMQENDVSTFKSIVLDTNPLLVFITIIVSLLHSLFEFLAFKNDISHFKNVKNTKGLSIITLFYNIATQVIVLLYLLDNDTSYVVLISNFVSILIEGWKITKCRDVSIIYNNIFPWIHITIGRKALLKNNTNNNDNNNTSNENNKEDNNDEDDQDDETSKHDKVAYKYLTMVGVPCLIAYSIYSLAYKEHTSWYSWVLSTLVSFIYAFGFAAMTPQLYLNYKLKSVAHMPWRVLLYKSLNTFIDDLFSFVIHMPWLHRIACLRDDVIFIVFLYQKWAYRVDYTRVNEFGQSFNDDGNAATTTTNTTADPTTKSLTDEAVTPAIGQQQEQEKSTSKAKNEKPSTDKKASADKTATTTPSQKVGKKANMGNTSTTPPRTSSNNNNNDDDRGGDDEEVIPDYILKNQEILRQKRQEIEASGELRQRRDAMREKAAAYLLEKDAEREKRIAEYNAQQEEQKKQQPQPQQSTVDDMD